MTMIGAQYVDKKSVSENIYSSEDTVSVEALEFYYSRKGQETTVPRRSRDGEFVNLYLPFKGLAYCLQRSSDSKELL